MRKLLALVLTASMPLAGVAQSPAPALALAPPTRATPQLLEQMLGSSSLLGSSDARSVPLWGTPDGRILALVAAGDNHNPTLPKSPQIGAANEWRLIDVTSLVSGGLLMRIGNNASAQVSLGRSAPQMPAGANPDMLAHGGEFRLGTNWLASDAFELGLSYDLTWLRHDNVAGFSPNYGVAGLGNPSLPLGLSSYSLLDAQNSQVNALGRFRLDDDQSVNIGASLGRIQLSVPGTTTPLTSLNQAAVSFGVQYGSFGGNLTGHVLSPADPLGANAVSSRLTGLDLGISWRTPWSGMFRVGTQNLWSSGNLPYLNNGPVSREIESSQARVPYVQYHQDL
ncbi:MAG: hypothetical protein JSS16_10725 [Proteobacteria bacterium]|uniref:hypothetical protein n=1 Tax=Rudaea sp. TaxID=2136325 RepID=UPI001DD42D4C|nr:hypothetical protein [Pseudomonadota bacterium]MBS0567638.1 hypothetical protein [Pseudomonadota bacterium]